MPLLAALILTTPVWSRRRGRALAVGLGLLTLTQIAFVIVTIVATQHWHFYISGGLFQVPALPIKQQIFDDLYDFFLVMGRGFFPLLIYLGLIALGWKSHDSLRRGRSVSKKIRGR